MWENITSYDTAKVNEKIYMFANEFNGLLYWKDKEGLVYESMIPEENPAAINLVSKLFVYENKIICIPFYSEAIWIYDVEKYQWKKIAIERMGHKRVKFLAAYLYDSKIIILPTYYMSIVILDLKSYMVTYDNEPFKAYKKENGEIPLIKFRQDIVVNKGYIYAALCDNGYILKYNIKTNSYSWIKILEKKIGFSGICFDGKHFWISLRDTASKVLLWDGNNNYHYIDANEEGKTRGISFWDGHIILNKENGSIIFDAHTRRIQKKTEDIYMYINTIEECSRITKNGYLEYLGDGITDIQLRTSQAIRAAFIKNMGFLKEIKCEENDYNVRDFIACNI